MTFSVRIAASITAPRQGRQLAPTPSTFIKKNKQLVVISVPGLGPNTQSEFSLLCYEDKERFSQVWYSQAWNFTESMLYFLKSMVAIWASILPNLGAQTQGL